MRIALLFILVLDGAIDGCAIWGLMGNWSEVTPTSLVQLSVTIAAHNWFTKT